MTASTVNIALVNSTTSNTVYAYVTGQLISTNAVVLLESDGKTLYTPTSPSSTGSPLAANCAIPLGAPGSTTTVTIPQIAGGRIWFSVDATLTFLLNPGPALVEPSVTNPSDPSIAVSWDFVEFTFNAAQLFVNISYVDFVCLPIALTLTETAGGATQHVSGMAQSGLASVVAGLRAQEAADGRRWASLIVQHNGAPLRVLSPNNGIVLDSTLFNVGTGYFQSYVDAVWGRYTSADLLVNTQASFGEVSGEVAGDVLSFGGSTFARPTTADIFSCSTGPFATGSNAETNTIIPRLAAGFNRSTLLLANATPNGTDAAQYYQTSPTNHYSRIVHAANLDGKGYAFPYDDVTPTGGADQSGAVMSGAPILLTVAVGGVGAYAA